MKLLKFTILLVTLSATISCIALEDEFHPTINDNIVPDKVYYYYDSLHVNVTFRDNVLIKESNVKLQLIESYSTPHDTVFFAFDTTYSSVNARLLQFDSTFVVPLHTKTGKYMLETSNQDAGDNLINDTTYFYIDSDTVSPQIENFVIHSENEKSFESGYFCRGDNIFIAGLLTDNVRLKRVGVTIGESEVNYFPLESTSISAEEVLKNKVSIPSNLPDGTYQFTFLLEDIFENEIQVTQSITIQCDNEPASLVSFEEESGIELPSDYIVSLFPGEEFNLSSLIFEDAGGLDSARLEITRYGAISENGEPSFTTVETPVTIALNGLTEANLATIFGEHFSFGFDKSDTEKGEQISISIKVKDINQPWENASAFNFDLIAKEDLSPEIIIDNLLFNDVKIEVPLNEEFDVTELLKESDQLQIGLDGVVNEEVGLASVKYTFISNNRNFQSFGRIIDLTDEELVYPVNLQDILDTTFPINNNEHIEGKVIYTLKVIVTDFKEQSDTVTYVLSVDY